MIPGSSNLSAQLAGFFAGFDTGTAPSAIFETFMLLMQG